jgi:hypothetical protein
MSKNWLDEKSVIQLRAMARSLKNCSDVKDIQELQEVEAELARREQILTDKANRLVGKAKFWFGANLPDLFNTEKYEVENDKENGFVYFYSKKAT